MERSCLASFVKLFRLSILHVSYMLLTPSAPLVNLFARLHWTSCSVRLSAKSPFFSPLFSLPFAAHIYNMHRRRLPFRTYCRNEMETLGLLSLQRNDEALKYHPDHGVRGRGSAGDLQCTMPSHSMVGDLQFDEISNTNHPASPAVVFVHPTSQPMTQVSETHIVNGGGGTLVSIPPMMNDGDPITQHFQTPSPAQHHHLVHPQPVMHDSPLSLPPPLVPVSSVLPPQAPTRPPPDPSSLSPHHCWNVHPVPLTPKPEPLSPGFLTAPSCFFSANNSSPSVPWWPAGSVGAVGCSGAEKMIAPWSAPPVAQEAQPTFTYPSTPAGFPPLSPISPLSALPGWGPVLHQQPPSQDLPEKQFACPQCSKRYMRSDHFNKHIKTHQKTQDKEEKQFACPQCSKRYVRSDHFSKHIKTHHPLHLVQ